MSESIFALVRVEFASLRRPKNGPMIKTTAAVAPKYFKRKSVDTPEYHCADSTLRTWRTRPENAVRTLLSSCEIPRSSATGSTVARSVSCNK